MEKQLRVSLDLEKITARGLSLINEKNETDPKRLQKANHFHHFISRQTKGLIQKYEAENNL